MASLGSLTQSLDGVRDLLAASPAFQARVGAAGANDALDHIFLDTAVLEVTDETLDSLRPFAVVCEADHGCDQLGEGDGIEMGAYGQVVLMLTDTAKSPTNHDASKRDFCNWVGQVIDEMSDRSGSNTYFPVRAIRMLQRSIRSPRVEQTDDHDYWWASYSCEWAVG